MKEKDEIAARFECAVKEFEKLLISHDLNYKNKSITSDGSFLFQFEEERIFVDIFPSGIVAVIVESNGIDELYDLEYSDFLFIVSLLKSASSVQNTNQTPRTLDNP